MLLESWITKLQLKRHHQLALLAQTFDTQRHHIALFQEHRRWFAIFLDAQTHARRGAGGDHVAWHQRHELAQIAHNFRAAENHGFGVAGLKALAVHVQPHTQFLWVGDLVRRYQPWANRAESVATLALVPLRAAL